MARFSSRNMCAPVSFAQASSIVAAQSKTILACGGIEAEQRELLECLGRVLANPLLADRDQPPFARATRDGFAVRAGDISAGIPLRVTGEIRAGEVWPEERPPLQSGEAIEIMTGAPLPPGADAVLMVEHVQEPRDKADRAIGRIVPQPNKTLAMGENVVPRGSEARRGQVLVEPGTRLGPDAIGLAASCGRRLLQIYRIPQVAILATGDEIVDLSLGETSDGAAPAIASHQIYDSNTYSLCALARHAYAVPLPQPAARDRKDDLSMRIRQALDAAPLLLLTGGVSMGRYDLVEEVLAEMRADFFFTGVKIQPGKPVVFGRVPGLDDRPSRFFFGLPGNPVSTIVTFRLFVLPLLAALAGERNWQPKIASAILAADFRCKPGLTRFVPAFLDTAATGSTVDPVRTQGSGDLAANAQANCYLIVPEDCEEIKAGQIVRLLLR